MDPHEAPVVRSTGPGAGGAAGGDSLTPADLGAFGRELGRGAEATVFELPGLLLPDAAGPLAYKRFSRPQPHRPGLAALIRARSGLAPAERARLDAVTAWPVRQVIDGGGLRGVVMPVVRPGCFFSFTGHDGVSAQMPNDLQTLLITEDQSIRAQRPLVDLPTRLRVARDAAAAMQFLHETLDVVLGDVSPRNTLLDLAGASRVVFIDCDSMRIASVPPDQRQLHSPDWCPPDGAAASRETDLYKLGLFVLRVLHAPRAFASVITEPDGPAPGLDPAGRAMLERTIGRHRNPGNPPSAAEWVRQLSHELGEAVRPPALTAVTAEPSLVVPGATTRIGWQLDEPARITVAAGRRVLADVDARTGPGHVDVLPERSGALRVTAVNAWGTCGPAVRTVFVMGPPAGVDLLVPLPRPEPPTIVEPPRVSLPELPVGAMAAAAAPWLRVSPTPGTPAPPGRFRPSPLFPPPPTLAQPPFDLLSAVMAVPDRPSRGSDRKRDS